MSTPNPASDTTAATDDLPERVRAAADLIAAIATDPALREALPEADMKRLKAAVSRFHHPDPVDHRAARKARKRAHTAEKNRLDDATLNQTGIRALRRKPVFTTPNYFPPAGFVAGADSMDAATPRESVEPQHCYVCKQKYSLIHHFYDQMCPTCAAGSRCSPVAG